MWMSLLSLGLVCLCVYLIWRRRRGPDPAPPPGPPPVHPAISLGIQRRPWPPRAELIDEFGDNMLAEERGDVMRVARANAPEELRAVRRFKETLPRQLALG